MEISAKRKKTGATVTVNYDFGSDLKALIAKFGEAVVFNHAKGSLVVSLQGYVRTRLDKGATQAAIQEDVTKWKPGERVPGKTPQQKLADLLDRMDPKERANLLTEYRTKAAAKPAA